MVFVAKSARPFLGLAFEDLFSPLSQLIKTYTVWLLVWQGKTTTNLTAECKPRHLQRIIPSNSKSDLRPWHLNPLLRFFIFHFRKGVGRWEGDEGANTCHISSALISSRCACSSLREKYFLPGLQRQEVLKGWNTQWVITKRSGAMLSLFSHQHVQLNVHRQHWKSGMAVFVMILTLRVNNIWTGSSWGEEDESASEVLSGQTFIYILNIFCISVFLTLMQRKCISCLGWEKSV